MARSTPAQKPRGLARRTFSRGRIAGYLGASSGRRQRRGGATTPRVAAAPLWLYQSAVRLDAPEVRALPPGSPMRRTAAHVAFVASAALSLFLPTARAHAQINGGGGDQQQQQEDEDAKTKKRNEEW